MNYNSLMIEPDLVLHLTDKVTIPQACQDCPVLADLGRMHDTLTRRAAQLANFVVSGEVDAEFDRFMERQAMPEDQAKISADSYKTGLRQVTTGVVDGMYEDADRTVHMAEDTIQGCIPEGTLTMRARRSGKQIVATFCMSARMERLTANADNMNESVAVRRTDIES